MTAAFDWGDCGWCDLPLSQPSAGCSHPAGHPPASAPHSASSGYLTAQMVRDAIQRIRDDAGYHVCGRSDNHVVHPKDVGWTMCANCFGVVWAGPGQPPQNAP